MSSLDDVTSPETTTPLLSWNGHARAMEDFAVDWCLLELRREPAVAGSGSAPHRQAQEYSNPLYSFAME